MVLLFLLLFLYRRNWSTRKQWERVWSVFGCASLPTTTKTTRAYLKSLLVHLPPSSRWSLTPGATQRGGVCVRARVCVCMRVWHVLWTYVNACDGEYVVLWCSYSLYMRVLNWLLGKVCLCYIRSVGNCWLSSYVQETIEAELEKQKFLRSISYCWLCVFQE